MSAITDRINILLIKNDIYRAQLCKATGLPDSTIRQWIKGSVPNVEALNKVAKYFDVSLDWLVNGVDNENPAPELPEETHIFLVEDEEELLNIYRAMTSNDKELYRKIGKTMVG